MCIIEVYAVRKSPDREHQAARREKSGSCCRYPVVMLVARVVPHPGVVSRTHAVLLLGSLDYR